MNIRDYYTAEQEEEIRVLLRLLIKADMEEKTAIMTSAMMDATGKRPELINFLEQNPNVSPAEIEQEVIRIVKAEA